jgi:3-deoxy-manno-octulosonate cytidylyltransferase (CMP-KDO synthetase)
MVLGVIPARYASVRLAGKPLVQLAGKPMIQHVWEGAKRAKRLDRLVVATDDKRIQQAVEGFGGEAVMTAPELPSGTDRVWAAAKPTGAELIINIQGDEPLLEPAMVDSLVETMRSNPSAEMGTLRFPMKGSEGYAQKGVVKVVSDLNGWALYFSRSPLPACKEADGTPAVWYKHLGFYAYRRSVLEKFVGWPPSALEKTEGLEQLRALEHGVKIKVIDSPRDTVAVDTAEDAQRVEKLLKEGVHS